MTQYVQAPNAITNRVSGIGGPLTTPQTPPVQVRQVVFDEVAGISGSGSGAGQVPGTLTNGAVVTTPNNSAGSTRVIKYSDATYNAITAITPTAFAADTVTSSITTETIESANFLPPDFPNTGMHKQLCIMVGDSIFASGVGSTFWPGVLALWNNNFMNPVVGKFVVPNKTSWGGYYSSTLFTASSGLQGTFTGAITAGNTPSITFTSTALAGSPVTISYTVQAADTLTLIAAGMAANINANANLTAAGISATSVGAVVTLTLPEPPAFVPALKVTKTNSGTATITLAAPAAVNPGGKFFTMTGAAGDFHGVAYTQQRVRQYSRMCFGMATGGWFFFELAGGSGRQDGSVTTGGFVNNQPIFKGLHYAASYQQVVFVIELGTNDFHCNQGSTNVLVPLYGSPTQGSPNLVTNGLIPLIAYFKTLVPNCKIVVVTPHARDEGSVFNGVINPAFVDYATYLQANKVSLQLDAIVDARTMAGGVFSPANQAVNTASVWETDGWNARYIDGVHLTPYAVTGLYGPAVTAALDALWPG